MMLADMGAEVVRIDRVDKRGNGSRSDVLNRGRRSIALDLKKAAGTAAALRLVEDADAVVEGFRPGVMERLGLGPQDCARRNPRLVYGRMTGWGQNGPLVASAGHDINYIALAGVLHSIGPADGRPVPPLNLVGDYAGGMMMAFGLVCAILEARASGRGQVIDAAMLDAAVLTMNRFLGLRAEGRWNLERGSNYLDGGAHFYNTYACADGKWISIGPIEERFYALLLSKLGIEDAVPSGQMVAHTWPSQKERLATVFATRTRDAWCEILEGTDVCFAPVLSLDEAPLHPHNVARGTFVTVDGIVQAAPAPRFSRSTAGTPKPPPLVGEHDREALAEWGLTNDEIDELERRGAFGEDSRGSATEA